MADTIFASASTTSFVTVGGFLSSAIDTANVHDWIRLNLTAGQTVQITVTVDGGFTLGDSVLDLRNSMGAFLGSNDDIDDTHFGSTLNYTATTTGAVYIDVYGYDTATVGTYRVNVVTALPLPSVPPLDTLDWGSQLADTHVTVFFAPSGQSFDGYRSEGFNAFEKARFQAAFDLIESVSGLTFSIVNSAAAADLKLVLDTNEAINETDPFLGYFNPPDEVNQGVGVFNGAAWDRTAGGSLEAGGYDFVTITHELLHGLGFAHPHDDGGTSGIMDGVTGPFDDFGDYNMNQGIFTTMSYNTGYLTGAVGTQGDVNYQFGYECGPMALDIALLQEKYGANMTTNVGNTVYSLAQANVDGTKWQAIWDAGGIDGIRSVGTRACVIDLRGATLLAAIGGGGFISGANGIAGGFTIANGALIENATGGAGADRLIGNNASNVLNGGAGADTMTGLGGNDLYIVSSLADVIVESVGGGFGDRIRTSVSFSLAADDNIEFLVADNIAGLAINLRGNALAQTLLGNSSANYINGLGGSDILTGGAGGDSFVFNVALGVGNIDSITDYYVAADRIILENGIFVGLTGSVLAATAFVANATGLAVDQFDRIIYETDTGALWFDRDGSGTLFVRQQFADLAAGLGVSAGEFLVV